MKQVCAWCKKDMEDTEHEGEGVTHGMCPEGEERELKKIEEMKAEREKKEKNPEMKIR